MNIYLEVKEQYKLALDFAIQLSTICENRDETANSEPLSENEAKHGLELAKVHGWSI